MICHNFGHSNAQPLNVKDRVGYSNIIFYFNFMVKYWKILKGKDGQESIRRPQNLHLRFDTYYILCQIDGEDFINVCGLLRKHEL